MTHKEHSVLRFESRAAAARDVGGRMEGRAGAYQDDSPALTGRTAASCAVSRAETNSMLVLRPSAACPRTRVYVAPAPVSQVAAALRRDWGGRNRGDDIIAHHCIRTVPACGAPIGGSPGPSERLAP
ncbi:hypothetical protein CERSUDRAFT_113783 [Gelatoporia subvermispora B]|uniref:Uncharacterized protein n=1 Tax=Ceriporiopsis subvermispora (strain B) TaxID=914234 RepID=M2QNH9_CERS8|nr:hypothetical protein CERSUDRAFT_113783 [Gelatoporia subvermispora B]